MNLSRRRVLQGGSVVGAGLFVNQYAPGWLPGMSGDERGDGEDLDSTLAMTEEFVPTTCWIGKQDCGMLARKVNGRLVKLEGLPEHPRNHGTLCPKGQAQIQAVYDPNRVKTPLIRTNGKGVSGTWRQASWEEALTLVGEKIKEIAPEDRSKYLVWQKGRSKAKNFYDTAFVKAVGAMKLHHGAFCSDAGYRAAELTTGLHGVLHPDFRHTNYLLSFGWDPTNGGGNKTCQITWHQQFIEARERGLKMVHLDPSGRSAAHLADRWLPIKPSTDIAFFLAIANVLIENGYVDRGYLSAHTNAPFLVGDDGLFLELPAASEDEKPKQLVWDQARDRAVAFDEATDPALEGTYTVDGKSVRPAFELFNEHVSERTPEWASSICDLPADAIRTVALEMGEAASIGSTIEVDGVVLPYRPVAIMAYHVAQQELGFQAIRGALLVSMLLGAIEAVGGVRTDYKWSVYKHWEPYGDLTVNDPPYNIYVDKSKFFPINSNNSSIVAHAMLDPEKWEVGELPKVVIVHHTNPVLSYPDQKAIIESYKKWEFVAVVDPWLSETADYFADVVLPAATIEKYEGPMGGSNQYEDATMLRLPPVEPMFDSRGDIDIYMDLCEKADALFGEDGYIAQVNKALKLPEELALDTNAKPTVREIFDRWAKAQDIEEGIEFFEREGMLDKGHVPASESYGFAADPPFSGNRHRFYADSLLRAQRQMQEKGAGETFWRLYTPFPEWLQPTMESSPAEYDLYLLSRKLIEFKQSRTTFVPLLNELMPEQFLEINPKAAKERGIGEGDAVVVTSHNAVTGETRSITTRARYLESIRPDTLCLPHHYGFWVNPITKDQGPTPNTLYFSGEGYVSNTADQSFQVKVKVTKA